MVRAVVVGVCLGLFAVVLPFWIGFGKGLYLNGLPILIASRVTDNIWLIVSACVGYFVLLAVALNMCFSEQINVRWRIAVRWILGIGLLALVVLHVSAQKVLEQRLGEGVGNFLEAFTQNPDR